MDARLDLVDRLLTLERRVCRIYQKWAGNETFSSDLRTFWREMAEDEEGHLAILERSAGLLNFAAAPPETSTAQIQQVEAKLSTAEHVSGKSELTIEEALGHALTLESSELNGLDEAWLRGFHPDLATLTRAGMPKHEEHIRRLCEAIDKFTADDNLRKGAAALVAQYQRQEAAHSG